MKRLLWPLIGLFFVPFIAFNPSREDFVGFLEGRFREEPDEEGGFRKLGRKVMGEVNRPRLRDTAVREDYLVFSLFRVQLLGRELRYLGLLGFFIALPDPSSD